MGAPGVAHLMACMYVSVMQYSQDSVVEVGTSIVSQYVESGAIVRYSTRTIGRNYSTLTVRAYCACTGCLSAIQHVYKHVQ